MSVAAARVGHRVRTVNGVTVVGVRGHLVAVEAHVGRGLPSLTLTGLPGPVCRTLAIGSDRRSRARAWNGRSVASS